MVYQRCHKDWCKSSYISHPDFGCALYEKSSGLCISWLSELDHLTHDVEVSIVEHGDTAFLGLRSDICVERKNLKGIFRKLDLSWSHCRWIWVNQELWQEKNAITWRRKSLYECSEHKECARGVQMTLKFEVLSVELGDLTSTAKWALLIIHLGTTGTAKIT